MTCINDIVQAGTIRDEITAGNIRFQTHPEFPELVIYNYTDQCAFNRNWNDTTRICRGLIVNVDTGKVLARPFAKFFNLGEPEAPPIALDQRISYANKYDGSLGILYVQPNGVPAIATRGSFASDQAKLGTRLLHDSGLAYQHAEYIDSGLTPVYEICGPDNRIVLKYETNELVRLGYIDIATGAHVPLIQPAIEDSTTLAELLARPERPNAEGWVIWSDPFTAVKLKYDTYVELHRIVTNLSEKEVWRQLRAGTYNDFKVALPDEWWSWAEGIAGRLREEFAALDNAACLYEWEVELAVKDGTRKEQALYIQANIPPEYRGLVFGLLDGRDISDAIWRMLEPRGGA